MTYEVFDFVDISTNGVVGYGVLIREEGERDRVMTDRGVTVMHEKEEYAKAAGLTFVNGVSKYGWSDARYNTMKETIEKQLEDKEITLFDAMMGYIGSVQAEDFEGAKAITEVLASKGMDTADAHKYIKK